MSSETKTPKPGEWWRAKDLTENAFICGFDEVGDPVVKRAADIYDYEMSVFLHHWHHEPRCTSFDWAEPPAIGPGEGYEFLDSGVILCAGDAYRSSDGKWIETTQVGYPISAVNHRTYRRKIKPAEVWPKWYVPNWFATTTAYFRLDDKDGNGICVAVDGSSYKFNNWDWNSSAVDLSTEAEALARVTPVQELCQMCCQPAIPGTGGCRECTQYAIETTGCPVDSPDDWVEINRHEHSEHIPRSGIDVLLRSENENELAASRNASLTQSRCSKISDITWSGWKWVCRRKDLPAKQPATVSPNDWPEDASHENGNYESVCLICHCKFTGHKRRVFCRQCVNKKEQPATARVPVRLYWYDGNIVGRYEHSQPTDESFAEILHDADGFYVEVTK